MVAFASDLQDEIDRQGRVKAAADLKKQQAENDRAVGQILSGLVVVGLLVIIYVAADRQSGKDIFGEPRE